MSILTVYEFDRDAADKKVEAFIPGGWRFIKIEIPPLSKKWGTTLHHIQDNDWGPLRDQLEI